MKRYFWFAILITLFISSCKDDEPIDSEIDKTDSSTVDTTKNVNNYYINPCGDTIYLCQTCLSPARPILSGIIDKDTTLCSEVIWTMTDKVWVTNGATLTIEPGTIIKAETKIDPTDVVALIITPGSKINAEGTASEPIIFTTEEDDISYLSPGNLTSSTKGQWGGVIIMGRATVDHKNEPGTSFIEGIDDTDTLGRYGNEYLDNDNSGILKYVSIRHGGALALDDFEINGLSLYGVGSATTIDYIEVFANDDDGIEFLGGTVEVNHALVTHCTDDSFDWDQGWTGGGRFWATLLVEFSDKGMECDGGEGDRSPNSNPTIANFTLVGQGTSTAFDLKMGTGGNLSYGIIYNFDKGIMENGAETSSLYFENIYIDVLDNNTPFVFSRTIENDEEIFSDETSADYLHNVDEFEFSSLSYSSNNGSADVIPTTEEAGTPYKGAFDPNQSSTWAANWTRSWELGLID